VLPSTTLPKSSVVELAARVPGVVDPEDPVPVSDTLTDESEASLVTVIVALNVPAALGENITVTAALCPAPIETGTLGEVTEKYFVERATEVMLRVAVPEFVA
jgi:hypothetical protein